MRRDNTPPDTIDPTVATLWIGGALGAIEQLCLSSFTRRG